MGVSTTSDNELLESLPLEGMRGAIARAMTQSLREMAQLTLHRRIDAEQLVRFRNFFESGSAPSLNDLLLTAVARALPRHPMLNATLESDTIFRWRRVHLGMAVAVDAGLVVPVIRTAEELSLNELRKESRRLIRSAREGGLTMADLLGGTFTVSNLGAFGVDGFTPIINPPQVAILGVGRVVDMSMSLSLTIDHRALDGVHGARFLHDLANVLENPSPGLA